MAVFHRTPTDPLVNLCIGLCYVHICCQKFTARKNWLILQVRERRSHLGGWLGCLV